MHPRLIGVSIPRKWPVCEETNTDFVDKIDLKFSISLHLVSLIVFVTEDIWVNVPKPNSMSATTIQPIWMFALIRYFDARMSASIIERNLRYGRTSEQQDRGDSLEQVVNTYRKQSKSGIFSIRHS